MSLKGKWRITRVPGLVADYPNMVEPAYILFEGRVPASSHADAASEKSGKRAAPKRQASPSPGAAVTKATRWKVTVSPSCSPMAPSTEKSNTAMATKFAFIAKKWTSSTSLLGDNFGQYLCYGPA